MGATSKGSAKTALRAKPAAALPRRSSKLERKAETTKTGVKQRACRVTGSSPPQVASLRRRPGLEAARALLDVIPPAPEAQSFTYLRAVSPEEDKSLIEPAKWSELPTWIALHAERGRIPLCFNGHELIPHTAPKFSACYKCGLRPIPKGSPILWCRTCDFWSMCGECVALPRLPALEVDPLFRGGDSPCLISWNAATEASKGTVIICPGGNYEFLCPNEAQPVVAWLADHGIHAVVLRYRLLPKYRLCDAIDDLTLAIERVRRTRQGPVIALGFSAGGHLIAALSVHKSLVAKERSEPLLDGQVLVYAGIDGSSWLDPITCGFFQWEACLQAAPCLVALQPSLLGGPGFAAPPSFLVYSIYDRTCSPEDHGDRYAEALSAAEIPHTYLRGDYGDHGFGIDGGWTDDCIAWLKKAGVGKIEPPLNLQVSIHETSPAALLVAGRYTLEGVNHDRPLYRKMCTEAAAEVLLFFWDVRDGPHWSGWWFAPALGWDHVGWARHSDRTSLLPPTSGWQFPADGI